MKITWKINELDMLEVCGEMSDTPRERSELRVNFDDLFVREALLGSISLLRDLRLSLEG